MKDKKFERFDVLLVAGTAIVLAALVYAFREVISPPVACLALFLMLAPLPAHPARRALMLLTGFLFFIWFVTRTGSILMPFIIALVLAYLFDPVADALERIKLPRALGVLLIVLVVAGVFALGSVYLVPSIVRELGKLIDESIVYSSRLADWVQTEGLAFLERLRIDTDKIQEAAVRELPGRVQQILQTFFQGALNITSAVTAAFGQLLNLVLVPFLFFYLLKDIDRIKAALGRLMIFQEGWLSAGNLKKVDDILSGYIRGQLIVCLIVAVLTGTVLSILKVPYALILGIVAGVLNLIPYIGLAITLALGLLVGIFSPSPLANCLKIVIVIEAIQILEGNLISPRIVGEKVGLHPVWIMLSILVFSHFWGFVGLLIAVPLAAIIKLFLSMLLGKYAVPHEPAPAANTAGKAGGGQSPEEAGPAGNDENKKP